MASQLNSLPPVYEEPAVNTASTVSLVSNDDPSTIKYKLRRFGKFHCMAVVAAVLFVLCVTFVVLYIVKKPKEPEKICDTMTCVYISEDLDKKMDRNVDPCDDFYAYSCGGFMKSHRLGVNQSSVSAFGEAADNILNALKGAIENASVNYPESTSITKTFQIYESCIDTPAIETRGIAPLQNLIRSYGGWRVTGSGFNSWTVDEKMGHVLKDLNVKTMLSIAVTINLQDSSKHTLQILGSSLGMAANFFITDTSESQQVREAYKTYMKTVARLLGGGVLADSKMMAIYDFEKQLAQATQDDFVSDDLIESLKAHHRSGRSLDELDKTIYDFATDSSFDVSFILGFLNTAFQKQGYTFSGNENVLYFNGDTYFQRLRDVYTKYEWDNAIVKDYIMWRVVDTYVSAMPSRFVEAKLKYGQTITGVQAYSRSSQCILGITQPLGMTLARLYVDTSFDESSKSTVTDMTTRIRQAFVDNLKSAKWMDSSTRDKAKGKALAIKEDVGYPSYIKDTTKLDAEYSTLTASSALFENSIALNSYLVQNNLGLFNQPVDKSRWLESPAQVNAYYSPQQNRIVILAGILQNPFYTKNSPKYMSYGAIGTVVGHEITHGFDSTGRLFNKYGNLDNWWSASSSFSFVSKAQCLIDQYNKYKVFGRNIKGNQTINENIADNGGIKIAYDAYQAWVKDNAAEGRLPGLGLSVDQLFFVGFAQLWCSVYKEQAAYYQLNFDVHSYPKYRVIGTLSNFDKFATAFSCPSGSAMNPSSKCSVW